MYLIESIENHHIIKEYNFVFQMQWRTRKEDGQADKGRWAGRPGKRTGDEGRGWAGGQGKTGRRRGWRHCVWGEGSGNIYLNKSWT